MSSDCQAKIVTVFQFISMDTPMSLHLGRIRPLGSYYVLFLQHNQFDRTQFYLRKEIMTFYPLHSDLRSI